MISGETSHITSDHRHVAPMLTANAIGRSNCAATAMATTVVKTEPTRNVIVIRVARTVFCRMSPYLGFSGKPEHSLTDPLEGAKSVSAVVQRSPNTAAHRGVDDPRCR